MIMRSSEDFSAQCLCQFRREKCSHWQLRKDGPIAWIDVLCNRFQSLRMGNLVWLTVTIIVLLSSLPARASLEGQVQLSLYGRDSAIAISDRLRDGELVSVDGAFRSLDAFKSSFFNCLGCNLPIPTTGFAANRHLATTAHLDHLGSVLGTKIKSATFSFSVRPRVRRASGTHFPDNCYAMMKRKEPLRQASVASARGISPNPAFLVRSLLDRGLGSPIFWATYWDTNFG